MPEVPVLGDPIGAYLIEGEKACGTRKARPCRLDKDIGVGDARVVGQHEDVIGYKPCCSHDLPGTLMVACANRIHEYGVFRR